MQETKADPASSSAAVADTSGSSADALTVVTDEVSNPDTTVATERGSRSASKGRLSANGGQEAGRATGSTNAAGSSRSGAGDYGDETTVVRRQ